MVGAPLKGRVVILDDVLTRGTAIREAISIIHQHPEAELVGIVQLVDREERGQGESGKSTVQEVEEEFNVPVEAVLRMRDIMTWMEGQGDMGKELEAMKVYREQYGIM
jgi:orotate phosphoribosyltransferase